jgi:hypothetical protein
MNQLRATLKRILEAMELSSDLEVSLGRGLQYFLGKPYTFTPSHMDFTGSLNGCVIVLDEAMDKAGFELMLSEVCALWMVFYPSKLTYSRLNDFLDSTEGQAIKKKMGGQSWKEYPPVIGVGIAVGGTYDAGDTQALNKDDMEAIKEACGSIRFEGHGGSALDIALVNVYEQRHGEVVFVPPAYGHYVSNSRWCLKAALHFMRPVWSLRAAMALHVLGPSIFGARNAEDYTDFAVKLAQEVMKMA